MYSGEQEVGISDGVYPCALWVPRQFPLSEGLVWPAPVLLQEDVWHLQRLNLVGNANTISLNLNELLKRNGLNKNVVV